MVVLYIELSLQAALTPLWNAVLGLSPSCSLQPMCGCMAVSCSVATNAPAYISRIINLSNLAQLSIGCHGLQIMHTVL